MKNRISVIIVLLLCTISLIKANEKLRHLSENLVELANITLQAKKARELKIRELKNELELVESNLKKTQDAINENKRQQHILNQNLEKNDLPQLTRARNTLEAFKELYQQKK